MEVYFEVRVRVISTTHNSNHDKTIEVSSRRKGPKNKNCDDDGFLIIDVSQNNEYINHGQAMGDKSVSIKYQNINSLCL